MQQVKKKSAADKLWYNIVHHNKRQYEWKTCTIQQLFVFDNSPINKVTSLDGRVWTATDMHDRKRGCNYARNMLRNERNVWGGIQTP